MIDRRDLLQWGFVSLIVGGVLIVAAALMMGVMSLWFGGPSMGGMMGGMMGPGAYPAAGFFTAAMGGLALWGLAMGAAVLVAAWRVRAAPDGSAAWGIVAIVAGALSLLAMGGWLLGAVAAVAGGALALVARTREPGALTPRGA